MRFTHCLALCLLFALSASPVHTLRAGERAAEETRARNGDSASQVRLGDHYHAQGRFIEALDWYRLAARQGQYDARRRVADMYIKGEGTDRNLLKGYVLLRKIMNHHSLYPDSQQSITREVEELATLLTPEQREQAETLIRKAWEF